MATVNEQITDAVTQSNVKNLGDAPGEAMAVIYQFLAQATGISMQNAVTAQQNMTTLGHTATAASLNLINTNDPIAASVSAQEILSGNQLAQTLAELAAAVTGLEAIIGDGGKQG